MAFDEVAVYFSEDEWDTLNDEQKALYKEVMLENYCALLALGLVHVKPSVISKIEKAEEPFVSSGQEETPAKPCKLPFDIASRRQALVEVQQPSGHGVTQPKTQVPSVFVPRRLSLSRGHQQKGHVVVQARTRVPRVFFPRTGLDGLTNRDIIQRFRLNREAILSVYQQVSGFLEPLTARSHSIPGMVKLLAILNFLATGCFQSVVGISQPSFSRHLRVVLNALLSLLPNYVCLPETNAEWHKVKEGFHKIAKMPNVLGAIDCIHVALRPPLLQQEQYRNSKQFHSLNVQVVCDADLRVLSVRSGFPGSCDKSDILLQSALFEKFEQGLMPDGWLLGDAEYERRPWLLSPLLNPSTPTQHEFNSTHENTHSAIKRTFDALKRRFQCLDRSVGVLQYSPRTVSDIFLVCCILHNLALQYNVPVSDNDVELQDQEMVPMDTSEGELEGKSDIITTHLQCSPFEPSQEPATVSDAQGVDYCSSASLLNDSEHNSSDTEQEDTVTTSETTHAQENGNAKSVVKENCALLSAADVQQCAAVSSKQAVDRQSSPATPIEGQLHLSSADTEPDDTTSSLGITSPISYIQDLFKKYDSGDFVENMQQMDNDIADSDVIHSDLPDVNPVLAGDFISSSTDAQSTAEPPPDNHVSTAAADQPEDQFMSNLFHFIEDYKTGQHHLDNKVIENFSRLVAIRERQLQIKKQSLEWLTQKLEEDGRRNDLLLALLEKVISPSFKGNISPTGDSSEDEGLRNSSALLEKK